MKFCDSCGRPLDKGNQHYDGTRKDFCNKKCEKSHERTQRPRPARKNHGVLGWGTSNNPANPLRGALPRASN